MTRNTRPPTRRQLVSGNTAATVGNDNPMIPQPPATRKPDYTNRLEQAAEYARLLAVHHLELGRRFLDEAEALAGLLGEEVTR